MSQRSRSRLLIVLALAGCVSVVTPSGEGPLTAAAARQAAQAPDRRGATTTRLPDGRWLVAGGASGRGISAEARIVDPRTGVVMPVAAMQMARTGHTATLLSDGRVLVLGGRGVGGALVGTAEIFEPQSGTFLPMSLEASTSGRINHTATLLTDGRVLIAGGSGPDGPLGEAEIWTVGKDRATRVTGAMLQAREQHEAELLADGQVRIGGGVDVNGSSVGGEELFDPQTGVFAAAPPRAQDRSAPRLVASLPENGAVDVALDVQVALRFSHRLNPETLNLASIMVTGPDGPVDVTLVSAEHGRLAFVSPRLTLMPSTTYVITIDGAVDDRGVRVAAASLTLTTRDGERPVDVPDQEAWAPDGNNWRSHRPDSPWQSLKPLQAPPGVTALAGQVLRLDGRPLAKVTLAMEGRTTRTDGSGRFLLLLDGVTTGEHTFDIDARTANTPQRTYGFYEVRWKIDAGRTNVLPFTIWSPLIDTARQVTIPSPTTQETVITTPTMPGLELHLPAGTTILDKNHKAVRTVSLTPIPLDRTPFPLPPNATFTMFFTIQPGGAYLRTTGYRGAWLVYPRRTNHLVGAKLPFFNYDPADKGWYVYGLGTVTETAVVPDRNARLYAFTGASFDSGSAPPAGGATPGDDPSDGDPVDPSTGAFIMEKTDLSLPDVMPLVLKRTYNSLDNSPANVRPFGLGMTHNFGLFQWSGNQFAWGDLILPDGGRIHFTRTSDPNGSWQTTEMENQSAPTAFYKSRLRFDGNAWEYALKDGTVYVIGHSAGLQRIRDRYGNETRLTWSQTNIFGAGTGNLLRVTSPNGRWIAFTYDTNSPVNRITDITDNIGRNVHYTYDVGGHLKTVTDPEGNITTYTWDANHRLTSIKDARNIVYLTNQYDANGRVQMQTLADPMATFSFAYTTDGAGNITRTEVTNPRGYIKRFDYNSNHYLTSQTEAINEPEARTITIERLPGSNLVSAVIDGLVVDGSLRKTEYTYDDSGHVQSIKQLANTPSPVVTSFTYEPTSSQLATITDPMLHTWTMHYDAQGKMVSKTDPLSHQTSTAFNSQGQVTSITDPLQHSWQFAYIGGDLVSATNPMGATTTRLVDGAGRIVAMTDALGRVTRTAFNKLNQITKLTNSAGGETVFQHDPNNRVLSRSDPLTHATTYTYDASDRVATRTDPLEKTEHYGYDGNGNLVLQVDRSGQITRYQYDPLDRLTLVTYADGSTKEYFYDVGNRQWKVIDSVGGTITRQYDGLDRLTNETTPEGSVAYTYDADGRRATMTVLGQQSVTYGYDDAHRLTSITDVSSVVQFTYDNADRQTTVVLPNGIVTTYGYDNADRLTSLTYSSGQTTLGDLTYTYDANGQRTSIGGTWAATGLPQALLSATYDAADRIAMWEGRAFGHDQNGNLTGDGLTSYTWSSRNQLVSVTGTANGSFVYDGSERRRAKTIEGTTTQFLYDGLNPVQELNGGTPIATLLTGLGLDEYFTRTDAAGVREYLRDGLGSSLALSDGSGTIQTKYAYEPFGAMIASGDATTNTYAFTGREGDGLGLTFLRARYYSPAYGRFISEDPIGFSGGANVYTYVNGDPVNYTDRLGLEPPDAQEMAWAVWNLGVANAGLAFYLSDQARDIATATGLPDPGNGAQDAFRHCLWSCLMADALGERASKAVGDEHENAGDRRGQSRAERLMDEANNAVGRQCAGERRLGGRKDEDPPECKDLCFDRLVAGQLFGMGGKPMPAHPWTKPKGW